MLFSSSEALVVESGKYVRMATITVGHELEEGRGAIAQKYSITRIFDDHIVLGDSRPTKTASYINGVRHK
jgi:hypothetical protein